MYSAGRFGSYKALDIYVSDSVFIEIDSVVLIQIGDGRNFLSIVLVKISKYFDRSLPL